MFRNIINAFKSKDLRIKLLITFGILFIYRIGCYLPIPGLNPTLFWEENSGNQLLNLMSAITGSALQNGAILAIGISPYINASIIVQLLAVAIPKFEKWQKQGEEGQKKLTMVTRIATVLLAAIQAVGVAINMQRSDAVMSNIFGVDTPSWIIITFIVFIMIAGAMLTMWLGEMITEVGVSNGISMLIFVGIIATTGQSIYRQILNIVYSNGNNIPAWELGMFLTLVLFIFTLIVIVDLSERRIPIQYAKQVKGRKLYGGQSSHIPIKLNASGVMPIIFSTALITFPQLLAQIFAPGSGFELWWTSNLGAGTWLYSVLVGLLILFFSYFYSMIQFKPDEVARNIQQYGGFIPGIRAGKPTAMYLDRVSKRLTLFGAIYLALIATVPSIIFSQINFGGSMVNAFTATGMMIVVSVAIEFDQQLESQLMMKHYKGFLK